jgi:hypothetical protein
MLLLRILSLLICFLFVGCSEENDKVNPSLPFELSRPEAGEPLSQAEISAFTKKITGFWKEIDYFRWCSWHSHGLHSSYDPDMPDYMLWWQDTRAIKQGDTVTFEHYGGADNIMIRTPKVLTQAISGYLASGDPIMRDLVIGYSKGIVALFLGMAWDGEDPLVESVTARSIFTHNHSYTTFDGRKVAVDYDPAKHESYDWNAHTVPNPNNPYFGDIWIRNMRSKDDVPHMYRVAPLLLRAAQDAPDQEVRQEAQRAYDFLVAFAKDIVDHGYQIRTKENGEIYIPEEDLASFIYYDNVFPNAECNPKLASALLGYGQELDNECDKGISYYYETTVTSSKYFNYAIVRYFHLAAITNSLINKKNDIAWQLFKGLIKRCDEIVADEQQMTDHPEWFADAASFLVAAAASGLPLTTEEARLIQEQYLLAIDHYGTWQYWDFWDASVPDGTYADKPSQEGEHGDRYIRAEEMTYFIEYCNSFWKNPAGAEVVDCEIVLDPSRWGE